MATGQLVQAQDMNSVIGTSLFFPAPEYGLEEGLLDMLSFLSLPSVPLKEKEGPGGVMPVLEVVHGVRTVPGFVLPIPHYPSTQLRRHQHPQIEPRDPSTEPPEQHRTPWPEHCPIRQRK